MNIAENMVLELKEDCEELYHKKRGISEKIQLIKSMINQVDLLSNQLKNELNSMKN